MEIRTGVPPPVAGAHRCIPPRGSAALWRPRLALLALVVIVALEFHAFLSLNSERVESYSWSCPSCHA
jgi:hypothetical protein